MRTLKAFGMMGLVVLGLGAATSAQAPAPAALSTATHPAVGSWYGKAMQVCATGVAPSGCAFGLPAIVLMMTPTLTSDGMFVADDSLDLGAPPFGPHGTAHGQWVPTSATEFIADYAFMLPPFPAGPKSVGALRARWVGQVLSADTIVGYVNAYFTPQAPLSWTPLLDNEFPAFPPEALPVVTAPQTFFKNPDSCRTPGCPLVFKFTIKRVAP